MEVRSIDSVIAVAKTLAEAFQDQLPAMMQEDGLID